MVYLVRFSRILMPVAMIASVLTVPRLSLLGLQVSIALSRCRGSCHFVFTTVARS